MTEKEKYALFTSEADRVLLAFDKYSPDGPLKQADRRSLLEELVNTANNICPYCHGWPPIGDPPVVKP